MSTSFPAWKEGRLNYRLLVPIARFQAFVKIAIIGVFVCDY